MAFAQREALKLAIADAQQMREEERRARLRALMSGEVSRSGLRVVQ